MVRSTDSFESKAARLAKRLPKASANEGREMKLATSEKRDCHPSSLSGRHLPAYCHPWIN
jgi:hypothetical protein